MQNSSVKNHVSCIMHHASCTVFLILALLLPSLLYAAPQMADYCYLPPFVTDPNTPPNIMIVFDRTSYGKNRAYQGSYDSTKTYYGFFESSSKYTHNGTTSAFEKTTDAACTTQLTAGNKYNCFSGNVLNFALMSTLDLARKAFIGFGWTPVSSDAGDNYSYSGATLKSYGASNASTVTVCNVSFSSGTYSYYFSTGNDGTGSTKASPVTIRVRNDSTCPTSSTGVVPANNKDIRVDYASGSTENRIGLIEKYSDKNQDLKDDYPTAGARFGMRRWKNGSGNDKATDIIDDSLSITATNRADYFKSILNTTSSSPSQDPGSSPLGDMMRDIVKYFSNQATTYSDGNSFTQSPYDWTKDPAASCRKNFAVFVSAGTDLTDSSPLSATCTSAATKYCTTSVSTTCAVDGDCPSSGKCMVLSTSFSQDACYGYTTDLSTVAKTQNVRTYVVHTMAGITCSGSPKKCTHNNDSCTTDEDCTNEAKLKFAAAAGGGEYIKVDDPAALETKIEEAILNILSTSASASTVATLTTQTRESSTLTQAYFYPKRDGTPLRWIGYLRLLWSDSGANLREDTKNSAWLDLKNDNILSFFYDADAIAYKAKTYADADGDLKIDSASCTVTATKLNDDVLAIWNAQTKLQSRDPNDRTIKVGIGDTSGKVSSSSCTSSVVAGETIYSGFCDFKTTPNTPNLADTFRPYWDSGSYCSDYTARWCGSDSGCNYCTTLRGTSAVDRGCSAAGDCYYCDGDKTKHCTTTLSCSDGVTGGCVTAGAVCGTGVCVGDCYKYYGTCNIGGSLVCDIDNATDCAAAGLGNACTVGTDTTGTCKAKCTVDTNQLCTTDAGCISDYHGTALLSGCVTTDTCTSASAGTCIQGCDTNNCATQVIKYVLGYDSPTNSSGSATSPGNAFRFRHSTITTADNTNTLKLGDIVYSTPRISPNSAVNGYDVTYKDTTYSAFVTSRIKGKCSTNTTCPNTSDKTSSTDESCSSGICTNDGYTPIVIVGANDGMVHAFKVSKIKDFSPAEDDCGGLSCDSITTGNQTAAFVDKPNSALNAGTNPAPPADLGKELWGYIPFNAMPYLRWYCNTSYCHIPMLDARFSIIDASIDYDKNGTVASEATETAGGGSSTTNRCSGASTSTCDCMPLVSGNCNYPWRRLLVGAMGAGGKQITIGSATLSSSIFVLDITNSASPKLLWERPLPDGTLTTSTPVVVRLASAATEASKDENGKWYMVIGSGPTSITTNAVNYKTDEAKIYVFDLRNGDLKATISTGATGVAVGDMMAVDMDSDYQVDDIYFGTYGGTGAAGIGKLYRLTLRNDPDVSTKSYQADPQTWNLSVAVAPGGGSGRPIFASPEIAQDSSGNIWIYFGTGVYLSAEHATSPAPNEYLYGFKESAYCWKGITGSCSGYSSTGYTQFLDATNITLSGAKATELGCFCAGNLMSTISCPTAGTCSSCGAGLDTVVTKVTDATLSGYSGTGTSCDGTKDTAAIDCLVSRINSDGCGGAVCDGWKRTITAQKSFSKPFVAGGLVDFTSFVPQSTSCSLGGSTRLWALNFTTGTAYVQPTIFACDAAGCSTATTGLTINTSINLGTGVPPLGESLVALPLSGDTYKVITQVSGGLPGTSMAPSLPAKSGYVLWIVK